MASEPNKKMEELLKAYAQQRREKAGAPFELHSVSRRLLLDEAARIAEPPQRIEPARLQRWRRFLPRLAFAGAVAILAAGLVWILIPGKSQKMQLAQTAPTPVPAAAPTHDRQAPLEAVMNQDAPSAKKKETLAARSETLSPAFKVPAPANNRAPSQPGVQVQPDTTSSQRQLYVMQDAARPAVSLDLKNEAERAPAASAGASQELRLAGGGGNEASRLREEAKVQLETRVNVPAPARPAAPAAAPVSGLTGAFGGAASTPPGGKGAVAEIPAAEKGLTPPRWRSQQATPAPAAAGGVLNVFELERAGSRVRIIDADGSIYAGELVAGPEAARIGQRFLPAEPQSSRRLTGPLLKQQPILEKARGGAVSHPAAEYAAFRATGTNRTLNLPVVIEAVFVPMAGHGAVNAPADKLAAPSSSPAPGASFAQPASPAGLKPAEQTSWSSMAATTKIQGTVRIGHTNQMTLDARPEER